MPASRGSFGGGGSQGQSTPLGRESYHDGVGLEVVESMALQTLPSLAGWETLPVQEESSNTHCLSLSPSSAAGRTSCLWVLLGRGPEIEGLGSRAPSLTWNLGCRCVGSPGRLAPLHARSAPALPANRQPRAITLPPSGPAHNYKYRCTANAHRRGSLRWLGRDRYWHRPHLPLALRGSYVSCAHGPAPKARDPLCSARKAVRKQIGGFHLEPREGWASNRSILYVWRWNFCSSPSERETKDVGRRHIDLCGSNHSAAVAGRSSSPIGLLAWRGRGRKWSVEDKKDLLILPAYNHPQEGDTGPVDHNRGWKNQRIVMRKTIWASCDSHGLA